MKILSKSRDHSSTGTLCSVTPPLQHDCCKTFFTCSCGFFYSLHLRSLGIFHVAFIKDFAAAWVGSEYCASLFPRSVSYFIKDIHYDYSMLNLKNVAGMDMYQRKQHSVSTIQISFFVILNYCVVCSFKIALAWCPVLFSLACYTSNKSRNLYFCTS